MATYEYKVLFTASAEDLEHELLAHATLGWRAVGYSGGSRRNSGDVNARDFSALLERPKKPVGRVSSRFVEYLD